MKHHKISALNARKACIGLSICIVFAMPETICAEHSDDTQSTVRSASKFDPFSSAYDSLFPQEMAHWKHRDEYLARGLVEGDLLRRKLLAVDSKGTPHFEHFCRVVESFQADAAESLKSRRSIAAFSLSRERLKRQLAGTTKLSAQCFALFEGRWFGRWGNSDVNHNWEPTRVLTSPQRHANSRLAVHATQYAWIGNGFGWNYLVSEPVSNAADHAPRGQAVLGMVYYLDGMDLSKISGEKAHVGFVDSPTRLVWITEYEVFLEEVFPGDAPHDAVYAITAIYHRLLDKEAYVSGRATQAVYTRNPRNRPEFYEFQWRPTPENKL